MYKLSIFDRDNQEILGIKWLISKYSLPIHSINIASQVSAVVVELENDHPDILCIELDMISEDK